MTNLLERYPVLAVCREDIEKATNLILDACKVNGTILLCGNGGSAADCSHIAGELLKGFMSKRPLSCDDKKAFGEREYSEIHRQMIEDARKELFSVMKENVIKLFSYEKYAEEIRSLDGQVIDAILSEICLTPGDMAYLKHHDVLYVTLTSAFPLEKELVEKVEQVVPLGFVFTLGNRVFKAVNSVLSHRFAVGIYDEIS